MTRPFWQTKTLDEMTVEEWESLCDGCGRCCVHKLEDEDTDELYYTNVACRELGLTSCRCGHYDKRTERVPDCLTLTPESAARLQWLPSTCAYRLIAEGRDLEWWHPLVSGDPETVHRAGISVRDKVISEDLVDPEDLEEYLVTWR